MQVIHVAYPPAASVLQKVPDSQVMAIGDFDGVHLGHQQVIRTALDRAHQLGVPASIMTFDPHPRTVLGQDRYQQGLTPLEEKLSIFKSLGVDFTYVVAFNEELMRVSPEKFVQEVMVPLHVKTAVIGFDFTFGHKGEGKADTMQGFASGLFQVEVVRPYQIADRKVSSTSIRSFLEEGHVELAQAYMGRPYQLSGIVVTGDRRGRTIGFPTANIQPGEGYITPANGVYAVRATVEGESYNAVMNIGFKPTFGGGLHRAYEVHLLDFQGDLYGKRLTVELVSYLREEQKFHSVDELIAQIRHDAEQARRILAGK